MSALPAGAPGAAAALSQASSSTSSRQPPPPDPTSAAIAESDPRVHMDGRSRRWMYEDDVTGEEFEWNDVGKAWVPVLDEEQFKAQQAAYGETVQSDEEEGEEGGTGRKRKASSGDAGPSVAKAPKLRKARPVTDVYVSNLPLSATREEIGRVFSRAGLLMTTDDGGPKIKLYTDAESGKPNGTGLVSYFKPESVELACTLFDGTELNLGSGEGVMSVQQASFNTKSREQVKVERENQELIRKREEQEREKERKRRGEEPRERETAVGVAKEKGKPKKKLTDEQKKAAKRVRELQSKLEGWDSDEEDEDPAAPAGGPPAPGPSRYARVVVLKKMFTLQELAEDPSLSLDLKEDVRTEAETLGEVTNVTLYDKEEDGVMTVKFKDTISAQACVLKMNGRFFGGQKVEASIYNGRERFKQSSGRDELIDPDDKEAEEKKRLDKFAAWLVDGEDEVDGETPP